MSDYELKVIPQGFDDSDKICFFNLADDFSCVCNFNTHTWVNAFLLFFARKSKISLSLKCGKCNRLYGIGLHTVTIVLQLFFGTMEYANISVERGSFHCDR